MFEVGVRALIKNHKGQVLLIKRARGIDENTWALPGGKVEFKELATTAIEREIREELGIVFKAKFFTFDEDINTAKDIHFVTLFFVGDVDGEIKINKDEIKEFKYFSKEEIEATNSIGLGHKKIILNYLAQSN